MRFRLLVIPILLVVPCLGARPAAAGDLAVRNADFATWQDGLPVHWTRSVGARSAGSPATPSVIEQREQGGVALAGDADTRVWHLLSQTMNTPPSAYVELRFRARALGLQRARDQFGSCYVGLILRGADGKPRTFQVADVRHRAWQERVVRMRLPTKATRVDVAMFLSQSGRLEVQSVSLHTLGPDDAFDVLVSEMDRHYSHFHLNGIDWKALTAKHATAARAARTPAAFIDAIRPMLAALEDGHVWIQAPDGTRSWPHTPRVEPNFDVRVLMSRLEGGTQVVRSVLSGRTPEGFGYLALGTMQLDETQYAAVEAALRSHFDTPGIILDLRVNAGGQETWGQRLCGLLARSRVHYASQQMRSGPAHDDLAAAGTRHVTPAAQGRYAGPVVALIGPGCVSSGEGMAMMLKAMPGIPLVGLPTRGSSGNPQPVTLPNRVTVWFSRWVSQLPDGTPIERRGVPPDITVKHVPGKDAALDEAVKILKAKAGKR